jgi:hypothetical protein
MTTTPSLSLRVIVALLAAIGLAGVLPVSLAELSSGVACPHLGPIPACHVVSIAYSAVLLSVLHPRLWRPSLFLSGWLPIFLLAAMGSVSELLGLDVCPKTSDGIPKCFFSLGLAVALILPVLLHFAKAMRASRVR